MSRAASAPSSRGMEVSVHKRAMDTYTTTDDTRANHNHNSFQPRPPETRTDDFDSEDGVCLRFLGE